MKWLLLCGAEGGLREVAILERSGKIGGMSKAECGGGLFFTKTIYLYLNENLVGENTQQG